MTATSVISSLAHSIGEWWLDLAWQFPLLVIGACVLERCLPRRWTVSAGGFFWGVLLLVLVVPPVVSSPTAWRHWADVEGITIASPPVESGTDDAPALETSAASSLRPDHGSTAPSAALFFVWLVGATATTALLVTRHRRLRRELARSWSAPPRIRALGRATAHRLGMRNPPAVVISNRFDSPALVGAWRPVITLPPSWTERSDEAIEHALLHEFTHVDRRDPWLQLSLTLLQVVYWYQPFLAIARRRFTHHREVGCDRLVVRRLGENAAAYRRTLLDEARTLVAAPRPTTSLGFLGVPASVIVRLEALRDPQSARSPVRRGLSLVGSIALAAVLLPAAPVDATQVGPIPPRLPARLTETTVETPDDPTKNEVSRVERIPTPAPAAGAAATNGCLQLRYAALYEAQKRAGVPLPEVE